MNAPTLDDEDDPELAEFLRVHVPSPEAEAPPAETPAEDARLPPFRAPSHSILETVRPLAPQPELTLADVRPNDSRPTLVIRPAVTLSAMSAIEPPTVPELAPAVQARVKYAAAHASERARRLQLQTLVGASLVAIAIAGSLLIGSPEVEPRTAPVAVQSVEPELVAPSTTQAVDAVEKVEKVEITPQPAVEERRPAPPRRAKATRARREKRAQIDPPPPLVVPGF